MAGIVLFCFFCSGMTGLIYEILWSRMIVAIVGCAPFAVSIILTVFMGGLGVGSFIAGRTIDRIQQPFLLVLLYGVLEILIGGYGLAVPFLVHAFKPLYSILYNRYFEHFLLFNFLTFLGCSILLFIPVIAMGATLPILCRYYVSRMSNLGAQTGRLYGFNTLGAAAGSMLCGFLLIGRFGMTGTLGIAVAINMLIGLVCVGAALRLRNTQQSRPAPQVHQSTNREKALSLDSGTSDLFEVWGALLIFAVSGFCAMAYEVVWTNLLGLIVGPTTYSFTLILATFITCLALGSILFGWLGDKTRRPMLILLVTQLCAGTLILVVSHVLGNSQLFFSKLIYHYKSNFLLLHVLKIFLLFLFMLPPCICLGATFPLVGKIFTRRIQIIGRSIGLAYGINTIGAVLGSFCAGFILIPYLGKADSIRLTAAVQLGTALLIGLFIYLRSSKMRARALIIVLLGAAGLSLCWKMPRWNRYVLSKGKYHRFHEIDINYDRLSWMQALWKGTEILGKQREEKLVFSGDGIGGFTCVMEYPDPLGGNRYAMLISGKSDASSHGDMRTQTLSAHLPMLFHPNPKNVMVVGLASGVTAGEVLCYPVDQLDVLEINKQVVEASRFFLPWNNQVLKDPRTRLIIQDARAHLQLTRQTYDVIISEPSNPWMVGLAALFTCDFFQLARERLKPDGLFVQFFHSYEMDWATFALVGRSFAHVFPNSVLAVTEPVGYGYDYLLVGFNGSRSLQSETAQQNFIYAQKSSNIRLVNPFLFYRMVVAENTNDLFGQGPLNTDAWPVLEYAAPKKMYLQMEGGQFGSDPEIWKNLNQRGRRSPSTIQITEELTGSIDRQIDYVEYALSVHSPFPNMVDLEKASEGQKHRLSEIWRRYCRNNMPTEFSVIQDPAITRQCRRQIAETIQERIDSVSHKGLSYYTMGDQYLALGENEQAALAYEKSLESFENSFVLNNYAIAMAQLGRMEDALRILEKATKRYPNSSIAYRTLAFLYNRIGRTEEAVELYQKALEIKPDYLEAAGELGALLTEKGRILQAIDVYNQIKVHHPQNAGLYNEIAVAYLETGRKQAAAENFAHALLIEPTQYKILNNLRQMIIGEEPNEAIRLSKIVCEITGNKNPGLLSALAISYLRAQQWESARLAAQQALELARQTGPEGLIQEIQDNLKRIESEQPVQ